LWARHHTFHTTDVLDVGVAIRDRGLTPSIPDDCPLLLQDIMRLCWEKDPKQRPVSFFVRSDKTM